MTENQKKVEYHLPGELKSGSWTYGDYEGFLSTIYHNLLPINDCDDLWLKNVFSDVEQKLNFLCERACGRDVARAHEIPSLNSMSQPLNWNKDFNFYQITIFLGHFFSFGFKPDDKNEDVYQFFGVVKGVGEIAKYLELAEGIKVRLPSQPLGPPIHFGNVLQPKLIFMPLKDILERRSWFTNENLKGIVEDGWIEVFEVTQKLYGFGSAYTILSEADQLPAMISDQMNLVRWQEVFRVAPSGTETSRVAWENIKILLKKE